MYFTDRVRVDGKPRRTADGYLVAEVKVARTGIQIYTGDEVGRPEMKTVRVYRPEEEVFSRDAMRSYAYRPITIEHPNKMVDAETWRGVATGNTGGDVIRDGEFVSVPLVLMDTKAVQAFESGKRELSMGYTSELVFRDGTTPDGQPYDAVQTNLRMNHLALVDRARGGSQLRIGDGRAPGDTTDRADHNPLEISTMSEMKTRTVMVDGLSVETTDAGAQAITKLQGDLQKERQALSDANTAHSTAMASKDAELAKKDAEIDSLKGKVMSDADLDKRVQARADLVATAKAIHDGDYAGKSDADIRKAVVVAKLGDTAITGKSDAYIDARFDILAEGVKRDPVRGVIQDGANRTSANDHGYADSVKELEQGRNKKEH